MTLSSSSRKIARATSLVASAATLLGSHGRLLGAQTSAPVPGFATIQGVVTDSVHNKPLVGALILVDGAPQAAQSGADGRYRIDSVPAGNRRLILSHPLLDTIGMVMTTPEIALAAGSIITVNLSTPTGERIVASLCGRNGPDPRGPGALMGQVRDPATNDPAVGAKVQLVYEESDPFGFGKKLATVREATVDASGAYSICGLPSPMTGKVQVFRNGVSSGEVPTVITKGALALRSLSVAAVQVATIKTDSEPGPKRVFRGAARVTGRVVNTEGVAVATGRVTVAGSGVTTLTNARGEFALDSLPAGTQSLEVRKIGYGLTETAVELQDGASAAVNVTMNPYTLPAVTVAAQRDQGLADIGYTSRKHSGIGYFLDGDKIRKNDPKFTDIIRNAASLKFTPTSDGHYVVQSSRDPNMGCVIFIVDRTRWQEMRPGDIDDYVRPDEVQAVEVYNPDTVPAEFATSGQTKCVTVLVWTVRSTNRPHKK